MNKREFTATIHAAIARGTEEHHVAARDAAPGVLLPTVRTFQAREVVATLARITREEQKT